MPNPWFPLNKDILFISDLHLALDKPEITRRFLQFLRNYADKASAVYILGDLFDAWIGDDDFTPPNRTIRLELKHLSDTGVAVYLQTGNRDFLLGQGFAQETGVRLLGEYAVIDLYGVPTLLTHGDLLCTDDIAYQRFREQSRHPAWQSKILSKPLLVRLLAARWYRLRSYLHKRHKTAEIMDVNQDTVVATMMQYRCLRLIHGHTHRPAVHDFTINGAAAQRYVLAAWNKQAGYILRWNQHSCHVEVI